MCFLIPYYDLMLSMKSHKSFGVIIALQSIFSLVVFDFREEDKNIFDYCRENNIEHVSKAISSKKVDVNTRDEEVGFSFWKFMK